MSIEESAMHRSGYRSGQRSGLGELALPARRSFLRDVGQGFGGLALAALLGGESRAAVSAPPHHAPRAKRVIWLFMTGAPSQMDTWDYKPELQARHGQPLPGADKQLGFFGTSGTCLASPFKWAQHGESGSWVSELFPHLSRHVDRMTFIHSCHVRANNHAPASMELMSGFSRPGMPSMGAWLDYGLGSLADDLPSFVVMHDAARPRAADRRSRASLRRHGRTAAGGSRRAGGPQRGPCRRPAGPGRSRGSAGQLRTRLPDAGGGAGGLRPLPGAEAHP
jgi:hypothetical protein